MLVIQERSDTSNPHLCSKTDQEIPAAQNSSASITDMSPSLEPKQREHLETRHLLWLKDVQELIRKTIRSECISEEVFKIMDVYKKHINDAVRFYNTKKCKVLATNLARNLLLFQTISQKCDFSKENDDDEYILRICNFLTIYTTLELRISAKCGEHRTDAANRISTNYGVHLKKRDSFYILKVLINIKPRRQREVMRTIYEKHLVKKPGCRPIELYDKLYVMYLIAYLQWMNLENTTEMTETILGYASEFIKPKLSLRTNRFYAPLLPDFPENLDEVTNSILSTICRNPAKLIQAVKKDEEINNSSVDEIPNSISTADTKPLDQIDFLEVDQLNNCKSSSSSPMLSSNMREFRVPFLHENSTIAKQETPEITAIVDLTDEDEDEANKDLLWLIEFCRISRKSETLAFHPRTCKENSPEVIEIDDHDDNIFSLPLKKRRNLSHLTREEIVNESVPESHNLFPVVESFSYTSTPRLSLADLENMNYYAQPQSSNLQALASLNYDNRSNTSERAAQASPENIALYVDDSDILSETPGTSTEISSKLLHSIPNGISLRNNSSDDVRISDAKTRPSDELDVDVSGDSYNIHLSTNPQTYQHENKEMNKTIDPFLRKTRKNYENYIMKNLISDSEEETEASEISAEIFFKSNEKIDETLSTQMKNTEQHNINLNSIVEERNVVFSISMGKASWPSSEVDDISLLANNSNVVFSRAKTTDGCHESFGTNVEYSLPLKKRKKFIGKVRKNQWESADDLHLSPIKECCISYPSTPMLSIACFEDMNYNTQPQAETRRRKFKTPAQLKEVAPINFHTLNFMQTQNPLVDTIKITKTDVETFNILPSQDVENTISTNVPTFDILVPQPSLSSPNNSTLYEDCSATVDSNVNPSVELSTLENFNVLPNSIHNIQTFPNHTESAVYSRIRQPKIK